MRFRINIATPVQKVMQYITVLKSASCSRLGAYQVEVTSPCSKTTEGVAACFEKCVNAAELEKNLEFRTVLSCAFVHPRNFEVYGNADSWYDVPSICQTFKRRQNVYRTDSSSSLPLSRQIGNQIPFIKKIQRTNFDPNRDFPKESIERYEKFMTLVKEYDGVHVLSPPFDVDIVWHAHMLDHKAYADATRDFFGHLLDHNDNPKSNYEMQKQRELTARLWQRHFGSSGSSQTSNSDLFFERITWNSYANSGPNRANTSFSADSINDDIESTSGSSCSSCSGCGSGCGGG